MHGPKTLFELMGSRLVGLALCFLAAGLTAACDNSLPATEREQIHNLIERHMALEDAAPDYVSEVELVEGDWARVRVRAEGVEVVGGPPVRVFLSRKALPATEAPTSEGGSVGSEPAVALPSEDRTPTGWRIVLGPQAYFDEAELSEAGVPESLWPESNER